MIWWSVLLIAQDALAVAAFGVEDPRQESRRASQALAFCGQWIASVMTPMAVAVEVRIARQWFPLGGLSRESESLRRHADLS